MITKMKKVLSFLLILVLIFSLMPAFSLAGGATVSAESRDVTPDVLTFTDGASTYDLDTLKSDSYTLTAPGEDCYFAGWFSGLTADSEKIVLEDGRTITDTFEDGVTSWYNGGSAVTEAAVYTPVYSSTAIPEYTVKFLNYDGSELQVSDWKEGQTPVYSGGTPVKDPTETEEFTFAGWDAEIVPVAGEAVYIATYTSMRHYPINYFGKDGEALGTLYAPDNGSEIEQFPLKAYRGYEFRGWKIQVLNGDGAIICEGEQDVIVDFVPSEALSDDIWSKIHADENVATVSLFARYEKRSPEYSYDVYYDVAGTRTDSMDHFVEKIGTSICLKAPATYTDDTGTYNFSHWLIEGHEYASVSIDVWPDEQGSYQAIAYYVEEEPQGEPVIIMNDVYAEEINGSHRIGSTMTYSLPDGYTLIETGFRYASTAAKANMEDAYYSVFKTRQPSGSYTWHFKPNKDTSAYYVAAYLKYKDKEGTEHTIYADVSDVNGRRYRYEDSDFMRVCWNVLY